MIPKRAPKKGKSKYFAKKTEYDGIVFDSKLEAARYKRRNVAPVDQMIAESDRSRREDVLPARPTPQPMQPDLTETVPEAVRQTVEDIPAAASQLYNRASQFLRQQEEEKLMGGG